VGSSKQNQRNTGLCDAESLGDFGLRHRSAKRPDFGDFFAGQKLLEEGDAADIYRMLFVAGVVNPFEICDDAIPLHTVDVIDHREVSRVWYERESHQSVNVYRLDAAVSEEIDVSVSEFVRAWSENLPIHSSGFKSVADAVQASDTAKGTNLVEISEVGDRNRSPFFSDGDIHLTGCPSGNGGTMIKDPSRASTFGGSAVMASASDNFNGRLQFR
jgi:hypothetical protein